MGHCVAGLWGVREEIQDPVRCVQVPHGLVDVHVRAGHKGQGGAGHGRSVRLGHKGEESVTGLRGGNEVQAQGLGVKGGGGPPGVVVGAGDLLDGSGLVAERPSGAGGGEKGRHRFLVNTALV